MFCEEHIRTGAWYDDQLVSLQFPAEWDVRLLRPRTPPPITEEQIMEALERPVGQPPIRELCRGKSRPLILVDDLNRPTPASVVIPSVLGHFQAAGISPAQVRILVASGTHRAPLPGAIPKKVGSSCPCQVLVHNPLRDVVKIGTTSFGTPVVVNKDVIASDFVMGISGVYPNNMAGFGGGAKLALGVLSFRSIAHLHYSHQSVGWGSSPADNNFRRDLDEIASLIGLRSIVSLSVNADREVVRAVSGDHFLYHRDEVAFVRETFGVPSPVDADVVISNAYPNDASLTFVHMKGTSPLRHCRPGTSRIAIASCSEGLGHHGLFPLENTTRLSRARRMAHRAMTVGFREMSGSIASSVCKRLWANRSEKQISPPADRQAARTPMNPIWLYRPGNHTEELPAQVREFRIRSSWSEILEAVQKEQGGKKSLRVLLYTCAPLQCFGLPQESLSSQPAEQARWQTTDLRSGVTAPEVFNPR